MKTNRTGKIARLPFSLREELNRRIEDGWSGRRLVRWLNELPEVREVLAGEFGGRSIVEQNLSAWKQSGYREWVNERKAMELARRMREDLEKMEDAGFRMQDGSEPDARDGGKRSMLETLALWTVAQFGAQAMRETRRAEGKEKWKMMRRLVADVCKLQGAEQAGRRVELQERRMRIEEIRWGMAVGLGAPPSRQDAKGELEGGARCEAVSHGIAAENERDGGHPEVPGTAPTGVKTDVQVTGVEVDQGKSRQIKGEKLMERVLGMGPLVERSAARKGDQGGSRLIEVGEEEGSPRRHEDAKGEKKAERAGFSGRLKAELRTPPADTPSRRSRASLLGALPSATWERDRSRPLKVDQGEPKVGQVVEVPSGLPSSPLSKASRQWFCRMLRYRHHQVRWLRRDRLLCSSLQERKRVERRTSPHGVGYCNATGNGGGTDEGDGGVPWRPGFTERYPQKNSAPRNRVAAKG